MRSRRRRGRRPWGGGNVRVECGGGGGHAGQGGTSRQPRRIGSLAGYSINTHNGLALDLMQSRTGHERKNGAMRYAPRQIVSWQGVPAERPSADSCGMGRFYRPNGKNIRRDTRAHPDDGHASSGIRPTSKEAPVRLACGDLIVGQGRKLVSKIIKKRRGSPPGIWGGRSDPGETTPNAAVLFLGENRIVSVGVGQSGSRHIGETFDALGTSLSACCLCIQLLCAFHVMRLRDPRAVVCVQMTLAICTSCTQTVCQLGCQLGKSFTCNGSSCLTVSGGYNTRTRGEGFTPAR